jgi:hypothetical protein
VKYGSILEKIMKIMNMTAYHLQLAGTVGTLLSSNEKVNVIR